MKSVMTHNFAQVPKAEIQRSSFDRTSGYKTTFNSGLLIPFFVDEALPGDTFNLKVTAFCRVATPIKPIMDNLFLETFFFSIPMRLVWDNWERFNGQQDNPNDSTDYLIPQMIAPSGGYLPQLIFDYMGIPTSVGSISHSALPIRAYQLTFNTWFRDQNLTPAATVSKADGPDTTTATKLQRRSKKHDYFTSALPWPQKGESVLMPLGDKAPISGLGAASAATWSSNSTSVTEAGGAVRTYTRSSNPNLGFQVEETTGQAGVPNIYANLKLAEGATINEIREAFQLQRMAERDARGGTRYTEIIQSHFGVTSPDARLQRPEYLGGGSSNINFHPVAQYSPSGAYADTPQGNLSAFGTGSFTNHGFSKSFTEHCIILGILNVRADLTYQQGLNRMWSRLTRYDFYWPSLAHLGEQEIKNKELFAQGTSADEETFAFQERYAEYRYRPSLITGKFRSSDPQSLDVWHLSQDFENLPTLSQSFIEDVPPMPRVIAVTDEPEFLLDALINLNCARPMPLFGVPGHIDHF